MYFLYAINSDRQTRLLNVLGQIAMILGDKNKQANKECAVVSLKPGHMDWVQDFDFKLNLFSLPTPPIYYLFLRRIPYRSLVHQ